MYLMIFKCIIIQEKSLIQQGISESQVLTAKGGVGDGGGWFAPEQAGKAAD